MKMMDDCMQNMVNEDFGVTIIVSSVILLYGTFIYLMLYVVNVNVENILLISILTSSCIISYDFTYRLCDVLYELYLKKQHQNKKDIL